MSLNKKLIVIGLILLSIVWTGNIFYYKKHVLKEPVFLKHYYDIEKGVNYFDLYYIQNINQKQKISSIVFPEIGEEYVKFDETDYRSNSPYYMMKKIIVNIYNGGIENIPDKYLNKLITKAEIHFSNGKVINADMGKIYIYNDEIGKETLKCTRSSSSNNNTGSASFTIDKDIKINSIYCRFPEVLNDILKVDVNNKLLNYTAFPIALKKGDEFNINYGYKFNKEDIRKNYVYNFTLNILTEDLNGISGQSSCFTHYIPEFPEWSYINSVIKNIGRD